MPLLVGFHPSYRIPDIPRDEWVAHIPARQRVVADERLIPTGELKPMDLPSPLPLKGRTLDDQRPRGRALGRELLGSRCRDVAEARLGGGRIFCDEQSISGVRCITTVEWCTVSDAALTTRKENHGTRTDNAPCSSNHTIRCS